MVWFLPWKVRQRSITISLMAGNAQILARYRNVLPGI